MATRVRIGPVGANYREDGLDSVRRGDVYEAIIAKTRTAVNEMLGGAVGTLAFSTLAMAFYGFDELMSRSNLGYLGFGLVSALNAAIYGRMLKYSRENLDTLAALAEAIRTNQVSEATMASFHRARKVIPDDLYKFFGASSLIGGAMVGAYVQQLSNATAQGAWLIGLYASLVAQAALLVGDSIRTKSFTREALHQLTSPADQPVAVSMSGTDEDDDGEDDEEDAGVIDLRPRRFAVGRNK